MPIVEHSLVRVRQRVEQWRRDGGGRGSRIPEPLWREAVKVAREQGVYATSKALRFNYYSLKERVDQAQGEKVGDKPDERANDVPEFVELQIGCLGGVADRAVIELVGQRGDRMRIEVAGSSRFDVLSLAQVFWRREA